MRKRTTSAATAVKDQLSNISLPTLGGKKSSRSSRKPIAIITSLLGLGAAAAAAKVATDKRYKGGQSQLLGVYECGGDNMFNPGIIVSLQDATFWAPASQREDFEKAGAGDAEVPYRIDTWQKRQNGLLVGHFGSGYDFVGGRLVKSEYATA